MGVNSRLRDVLERKAQTIGQSNVCHLRRGTSTSTLIDFQFRFISAPEVTLTPWKSAGGGTCSGLHLDQDVDGYYTGATIEMNADYVVWTASGDGIAVET
jgi:hypothetical protein